MVYTIQRWRKRFKVGGPKAMTKFPSPTSHIACPHVTCPTYVGFSTTVLATTFASQLKFSFHNHFFKLRHQEFNCCTETRTKNRGFKAHLNWTCGQGNCVAKIYCYSSPNSYCKYHNRSQSLYLSATIGKGLKNRAPLSN